jgi:dTDP-4-dehydrorhamnose 3,5-epimerase
LTDRRELQPSPFPSRFPAKLETVCTIIARAAAPSRRPQLRKVIMKILQIQSLAIPDVQVIRFARFRDSRGYFTETYRRSDLSARADLPTLDGTSLVQVNESFSRAGVARGLHFQWNPFMGKLVRTVSGRMVDLFLDIRLGSPTLGRIAAYDLPAQPEADFAEWIWVPPGFAHGNYFTEPTVIEYGCTGEYRQGCEAGISPLAADLDWSLCDPKLASAWKDLVASPGLLMTDKDRGGLSLAAWLADPRSANFRWQPTEAPRG